MTLDFLKYAEIAVKALGQRQNIEAIITKLAPIVTKAQPIVAEVIKEWPHLAPKVQEVWTELFGAPARPADPSAPTYFSLKWLQDGLNKVGMGPIAVDGVMGPQTHDAIKKYQQVHGLVPDGWAGIQTTTTLYNELARKK
jgi:hypothetical protein